jgi:hypothetical protein
VGDFTVFRATVLSATRRSTIRLVGLRDRAFESVDSVTDDAGRSMSSLSISSSPSNTLGIDAGIAVSSRAGTGMVGAGGAGAGLYLTRTGRGVALGSITSSTTGALSLVSLAFPAAILLDIFDGDRGACHKTGVGSALVVACTGANRSGGRSLRAQHAFVWVWRRMRAEKDGRIEVESAQMRGAAFEASAGSLQGFAGRAAAQCHHQHRGLPLAMRRGEPWAQRWG